MHSMNMYKYQYTASFKKIYVNAYSLQTCKKKKLGLYLIPESLKSITNCYQGIS